MKHLSKIIILGILIIGGCCTPLFSEAAGFVVTENTPIVTPSAYTASYTVTSTQASLATEIYVHFSEHLSNTWNYNATNGPVIKLEKPGASGYSKTFNVEFPFANLGIVAGKKYQYYLAEGPTKGSDIFYNPTCFTTTGKVSCDPTPANPNPALNQLSFTVIPGSQIPYPANPAKFQTPLTVTSNVQITSTLLVTLKLYTYAPGSTNPQYIKEGTFSFLPGVSTINPSFGDLDPGNYSTILYDEVTQQKISGEVSWKVVDPTQPPGVQLPPSATPSPANYVGGISIYFNPADQKVDETSATLKATVSVQIEMPVAFQVLSGSSPSKIDRVYTPILQPISANSGLVPGEVKTFTIPFTSLTKGTTYYFIVKNIATGTQSPVWNFTTKGGTQPLPESAMTIFDATTDPYGDPGSFKPVEDTISEKGIVPKCGRTQNAAGTIPKKELEMCTYKDFMQLIANVIQYALIIIGPIIAIVCMYAGAMIIWLNWQSDPSQQIEGQIKKYQGILVRAAIGVGIILIAWVLVATVIKELGVKPEFVLLDLFSSK